MFQTIDSNTPECGISYQRAPENFDKTNTINQPNAEDKDARKITHKDKRKSISRRVSFSSKTRVKEFHEGQHEVRQYN